MQFKDMRQELLEDINKTKELVKDLEADNKVLQKLNKLYRDVKQQREERFKESFYIRKQEELGTIKRDIQFKDKRQELLEDINKSKELAKRLKADKNLINKLNELYNVVRNRQGATENFYIEKQEELGAYQNSLKLKQLKKFIKGYSIVMYVMVALALIFLFSDVITTIISNSRLDGITKSSYIIITALVDIVLFFCYVILRKFQISTFYGRNGEKIPNIGDSGIRIRSVLGGFLVFAFFYIGFIIREITINTIYPSSLPFLTHITQIIIQMSTSSLLGVLGAISTVIAIGQAIIALGKYVWKKIST